MKEWEWQGGTLSTGKGGTALAPSDGGRLTSTEYVGVTRQTPGAIVRVEVKDQSPLTIGYPDSFHVLSRNTRLFSAGEGGSPVHSNADRSEERTSDPQSIRRISYAVFGVKKNKTAHATTREKTT